MTLKKKSFYKKPRQRIVIIVIENNTGTGVQNIQ